MGSWAEQKEERELNTSISLSLTLEYMCNVHFTLRPPCFPHQYGLYPLKLWDTTNPSFIPWVASAGCLLTATQKRYLGSWFGRSLVLWAFSSWACAEKAHSDGAQGIPKPFYLRVRMGENKTRARVLPPFIWRHSSRPQCSRFLPLENITNMWVFGVHLRLLEQKSSLQDIMTSLYHKFICIILHYICTHIYLKTSYKQILYFNDNHSPFLPQRLPNLSPPYLLQNLCLFSL